MQSKPSLYLLPGLLCDRDAWQHQAESLAVAFDVRIPDYRGIYSLPEMATMILAQAPASFAVAGHSMGGRVALELVHRAPARIERLALLSVGAHRVTEEECYQRTDLLDTATSMGMENYAAEWADLMLIKSPDASPAARHIIKSMAARQTLDEFAAQIHAGLTRPDQWQYLADIEQEVLLVCGDRDAWSPVSQHEAIRDALPHATLRVVRGAGHMVTLEQPEAVSRLLADWFIKKSL